MRPAVLLLIGVGAFLACGNPTSLQNGRTNQLTALDFEFIPAMDTVNVGTTVFWSFPSGDTATHSINWIVAPPGAVNSGDRRPGAATYSVYAAQAGTYTYYCRFHGATDGSGMAGTLIIQ